jgi:hypothetical protein
MNTNREVFAVLPVLAFGSLGLISSADATIRAAATCSFADVSVAISAAAVGDTVTVPAGTCTWSSMQITKGISLIGAGIGQTTIVAVAAHVISYAPANPSTDALFRVSGFTFDFAGSYDGMLISSGNTIILQTNIRIDNNRFQNIPMGSTAYQYIHYRGVRGVIDNNAFGRVFYPLRTETAPTNDGGKALWNNQEGVLFGVPANNIYFEDNVFEQLTDPGGVIVTDCQEGGRYAFRYNTINLSQGAWPLFDMHGNNGQQYSCMGGEIYGNNVIGGGGRFLDQRGGRVFVFNNSSTVSMAFQIREEQADSTSPVNYVGPNGPQYPQHVNGSYYWGSRLNLTGAIMGYSVGPETVGGYPLAGRDFFTESTSPGISCGTPANRPATCTNGQGYWATTQSCVNLAGMVGTHPSVPISGTLYRCGATNTWDSGSTPLPYPHPLRGSIAPVFLHPAVPS